MDDTVAEIQSRPVPALPLSCAVLCVPLPNLALVCYWAVSCINQTQVWTEFYLEGIGWIPVDATIGQQGAKNRAYYFGNMDAQHVILSKEFNTPLIPAGPNNDKAAILQTPSY